MMNKEFGVSTLLEDFEKFEAVIDMHQLHNEHLDLTFLNSIKPTTLLPIFNYGMINSYIKEYHIKDYAEDYVKKVLGITEHSDSEFPFEEINPIGEKDIPSKFCKILDLDFGGKNALMFLMDEIITNMYDHSKFNKGYTLAHIFHNNAFADICFIDNGVSIPGRFEKDGFKFKDDCSAITQAVNGRSSDILRENRRGTGLNSTINMMVNGNGGSVLIASRNGLLYIDKKGKKYKRVKDNYIQGTFVSIRVRRNKVNIYPYMKKIQI
ncbi:MAG: hypothetical protein ACRC1M_07750 [Methanobacteriaceae archaeon]